MANPQSIPVGFFTKFGKKIPVFESNLPAKITQTDARKIPSSDINMMIKDEQGVVSKESKKISQGKNDHSEINASMNALTILLLEKKKRELEKSG